ncbi:MAG: lytic transglycosylase domain-containing protein [Deltaproteobacteria bacterium]|nr:lytic transglycosylase domain-containing protein [Deltaproteobacteria bacterium]
MEDESLITLHTATLSRLAFVAGMLLLVYIPTFFHGQVNTSLIITNRSVIDMEKVQVMDESSELTVKADNMQKSPVYWLKGERLLHPIIERVANNYEVDPALIKAIVMVESRYNSKAVSTRGARGLMQLMPSTAEELGVEDSFNPEHNITGGVKYFKGLLNRYDGDVKIALAAYNAGSGIVSKYNGIPPYKATRTYIAKVIEYYKHYKGGESDSVKSA